MAISNGINTALTGVFAATRKFQNSANNVANRESRSGPNPTRPGEVVDDADGTFRPRDIDSQSLGTGGVSTLSRLRDPSSVQRFEPNAPDADDEGLVYRGNVPLEKEVTDQISASRQFEANLAVIRAGDDLYESLLDIKS